MREYRYTITGQDEGMTVQTFLRRRHQFSARALTKLKQSPRGLLRGGAHIRTVDVLHEGDVLSVTFEETEKPLLLSAKKVPILYEDEDLLIYNKPADMPCHTSCGHAQDTLENVFASHCARQGLAATLRALNRLDRDTSGCVLVGKNQFIASRLKGNFEKAYRALVVGAVDAGGRVEGAIYRPDPVDMRRTVDPRGQTAATEYTVLCRGAEHSFLQFHLLSGRTHQIRVHMAHIGHPVLGDTLYGSPSPLIGRQALHCHSMSFIHPVSGALIAVTAPLPPDMCDACAKTMGSSIGE